MGALFNKFEIRAGGGWRKLVERARLTAAPRPHRFPTCRCSFWFSNKAFFLGPPMMAAKIVTVLGSSPSARQNSPKKTLRMWTQSKHMGPCSYLCIWYLVIVIFSNDGTASLQALVTKTNTCATYPQRHPETCSVSHFNFRDICRDNPTSLQNKLILPNHGGQRMLKHFPQSRCISISYCFGWEKSSVVLSYYG